MVHEPFLSNGIMLTMQESAIQSSPAMTTYGDISTSVPSLYFSHRLSQQKSIDIHTIITSIQKSQTHQNNTHTLHRGCPLPWFFMNAAIADGCGSMVDHIHARPAITVVVVPVSMGTISKYITLELKIRRG